MFVELIATLFAGLACAGVVMLMNLTSGRRLPKWLVPVAAGLGMITMTLYNEYTWFDRTAEKLPEGVQVALTVKEQGWLRPWTQLWPYTKRFVAVDMATTRKNEKQPGQRLADLYFFGRWSAVNRAPVLIDCAGSKSALLVDGAEFSDDGSLANAHWVQMPADDPILKLVCGT
ncbi:MAG: hypothetical protein AAGF81_18725 [Pseudomonadota bacterium]